MRWERRVRRIKRRIFFLSVFLIWYIDCIPDQPFTDSTSTILLDRNGQFLSGHISSDEQWRFEACDSVPYKFKRAIVEFEDRRFYRHFGVSIPGITRAIWQNLSSGERISGGSTLTMQVIRLMRKNPKRTYLEKVYEIILATRLECSYSKEEILKLYASHAPFGNNVVGLDAAAWRFFGRPAHELSWAESATLAVLPNAPGLIYPGKNHNRLLAKRNRLLAHLHRIGEIDATCYELSLLEPLPTRPHPLPNGAPHLLNKLSKEGNRGKTTRTTLDVRIQNKANDLLEKHLSQLRENQIFNGAIVITDVKTGEIIAYVGNAVHSGREHASYVDCIPANRSSGSILKPLLYEKALESGQLTPEMLLLDVPSKFGGFSPKNFTGGHEGMIPADEALSQSLNIPMVHLLNEYGLSHFHSDLQEMGFSSIRHPAMHYGLSLILGGAEVKLSELSSVYTSMAQTLRFGKVYEQHVVYGDTLTATDFQMDRACIYSTFDALLEVRRPDEDNQWQLFESSRKIAWKTGTSFGFRDAWAVGVTPDYVVSVWIGNADGEGRPGLVGVKAAAPLLFDLFRCLPTKNHWFQRPLTSKKVEICSVSGHRATTRCPEKRMAFLPDRSLSSVGCPYHVLIHLDENRKYRVHSECAEPSSMIHQSWFVLAPAVEKWYAHSNPEFRSLPPMRSDCNGGTFDRLALIYPKNKQQVYLPLDFSQSRRSMTVEAASSAPESTVFWHLDDVFIGQTQRIHQLEIQPESGQHILTITDLSGQSRSVSFEVLGNATR